MPGKSDRRLGVWVLLGIGAALEGVYAAMAARYGTWSLRWGEVQYFWVYGTAVVLYLAACAWIWRARPRGRAAAVVLGLAALFRLTLLLAPPAASADVFRYVWDGRVLTAGINPYLYPPSALELAHLTIPALSQVNSPDVVTPYPPLAEAVFAVLYRFFPGSILAIKTTVALADLATIGLLALLLRQHGQPVAWAAVYAWSPLVVQEFAGHGHIDALWLPLLLAAILLATRGSRRLSGLALALAVLLKASPALAAPTFLRRWRLAGLAAFVLTIGLGAAPFLGAGARFMAGAAAMADRWEGNSSLYYWIQLANRHWEIILDADHPARLAGAAIAVGAALATLFRRPGGTRDLLAACFWVFAISLLVSATVFPWYAAWLLPPLTVLLATGDADPARPAYAGTAWAGVVALRRPRSEPGLATRPSERTASAVRVGVVIPALDEAAAIARVIAGIPRQFASSVVVVDGGSADGTPELAEAAGARVVRERRRGYGRACATGVAELPPEVNVAVFLDGDLSDYPEEMGRLVEPIAAGRADLVVGSRLRGRREPGALPLHSALGNWLAARLMRLLYGLPITDLGPFRAIRRERLTELAMSEMTYGWPVEMLAKAARRGLRVSEVPVGYRRRVGRSKITGTVRGSLFASYFILSRVFRYLWA